MPGVDYAPDPELPAVKPLYQDEGRVGNIRTAAQLDELSEEDLRAERREAIEAGRKPPPTGSPRPTVIDSDPDAPPEVQPGNPKVIDFDPHTQPQPGEQPRPLAQILKEKEEQDERINERPRGHASVVPDRAGKPEGQERAGHDVEESRQPNWAGDPKKRPVAGQHSHEGDQPDRPRNPKK